MKIIKGEHLAELFEAIGRLRNLANSVNEEADIGNWKRIDTDDFTLVRYGMMAHVEEMAKGHWWFAISPHPWVKGQNDLYNTADNLTPVHLTTGKMARAAAECCLELLHHCRLEKARS